MDELLTSIQFASSKDVPIQRTRITTDIIISQTPLTSEPVYRPPTTTTKTQTITVSNTTTNLELTAIASNVKSIVDSAPSSTNTDAPSAIPSEPSGLPSGAVAGIIFGILTALAIISFVIWWFARKRKRLEEQDELQNNILNPEDGSFRVMNQPPLAELEHSSLDLRPPEPVHRFEPSTPEDSRLSSWGGTQFSTPRPAVAEVKSYTRAGHKPRVYDIGGGPISELSADNGVAHATFESFKMVPMSRAEDENFVSPVSPGPQARPLLPWDDVGNRPWTTRRN